MAIFEKNISQNNKTAGAGVLDGPFAWGSEPKRAYNAALFFTHEAHVIIKTQAFLFGFSDKIHLHKNKNPSAIADGFCFYGVRYGARTHDLQGHNLTR